MATALLFAQFVATGLIASWLALGLRDNILYPALNGTYTGEVMQMTRMQADYPEAYQQVAHRAVTDPRLHRLAFRAVVLAEALATLVLTVGTLWLLAALIGLGDSTAARAVALTGAALFTGVWGGFLVIGNHFSYWFCHEGAQNTHYQMTLWGVGTMILLAQGAG